MSDTEKSMVKRVLLLVAAVAMATMVWFVVGDESIAAESGKAGDQVLATVNGEEITEQAIVAGLAGRLLALDRERHDMIQGAVQSTIIERLFQQEADKRGVSVDELRETEVAAKAEALSQEEIDTFYEAQKKRSGGRIQPQEQMEPRIREYLALQAVETSLRGEAKIATHIDPFRIDVAATGPGKGPENAKVTIVEFSDFQCPYCSRVNPTLEQVTKTYGDKVRIVFRQFPLVQIHPNAMGAGMASLCADEQDKFWQMHDAMFADQQNLGSEGLAKIAGTIEGMDVEAFSGCLESDKFRSQVERDLADGSKAGVTGTPAMFINGRFLNGAVPFEQLSAIIDEELEG
jgi:protein-disulfide isomerase